VSRKREHQVVHFAEKSTNPFDMSQTTEFKR